jgi:UDP-N-acetylmuramoylalanine--D-glutamate ligase
LIDRVDEIALGDKLLLELSSFQLQLFDSSPHVGAVLNITPNHLDRHPSMSHYTAAKASILRWQGSGDIAVLGADDAITGSWWRDREVVIAAGEGQSAVRFPIHARCVGFGLACELDEGAFLRGDRLIWRDGERERVVCTTGELLVLGRHNVANVLAACAIAGAAGASAEAMRQVATTFEGVAHRLELVCARHGVSWYNDSIATAPERVTAALRAFDRPIVLLAGGRDKYLPWDEMADLAVRVVRHLILFGEAADLIASAVQAARTRAGPGMGGAQVHRCAHLEEAVHLAARVARRGDVVLLSPGGTSFDAYRDFEERGRHFRALVAAL